MYCVCPTSYARFIYLNGSTYVIWPHGIKPDEILFDGIKVDMKYLSTCCLQQPRWVETQHDVGPSRPIIPEALNAELPWEKIPDRKRDIAISLGMSGVDFSGPKKPIWPQSHTAQHPSQRGRKYPAQPDINPPGQKREVQQFIPQLKRSQPHTPHHAKSTTGPPAPQQPPLQLLPNTQPPAVDSQSRHPQRGY